MEKSVKLSMADYKALRAYADKNGHYLSYVLSQAVKLFLQSKQEKAA